MAFVHLHNHTEFSGLDGAQRLEPMCARAAELGQNAMAISDHGSLAGTWRFTQAAKAAGIKPVIGMELYMAIGSRFERNSEVVDRNDDTTADADEGRGETKEKRYEHLTVIARNETGWKNLLAIHNQAEFSYWYKPRADYELLREHGEGLMVLTGCLAGPVAGPLSRHAAAEKAGDVEASERFLAEARKNLDTLIDCVGRENVYLEVMYHGIDAEKSILQPIGKLSREYGIPMVATNDCHYEREEHSEHHAGFLAVGSKKGLDDPTRFKFNGEGYYIKSEQEMLDIFPGSASWAEAVAMTQVIADRCDEQVIPEPHQRLPKFPIPDGFEDSDAYLKSLVRAGAVKRYGDQPGPDVAERLRTELGVISRMGFPDYFLIVWDVINWCRSDLPVEFDNPDAPRKKPILVGPGRGSAAGSCVSYCLEIVGIDPLANNLLFERFLEEGRAGMPDIDVDFEKLRRDEVFAYLAYRWGQANVARIGTFGMALSKASIKDAARILKPSGPDPEARAQADELFAAGKRAEGAALLKKATKAAEDRAAHILRLGNKLSDLVPGGAKPYTFAKLEDTKDPAGQAFRDLVEESGQDAHDILNMARFFEGMIKTESIHACGFVVSPEPLDELVPLRLASHEKNADPAAPRVICWDGPQVESYGFLKMDVLGLLNLDIISRAFDNIEATTGEHLDMGNIPHPDTAGDPRVEAAYELIGAGRTASVFQMESSGMKKVAQDVVPSTLTDLSAIVALFRPGPLAAKVPDLYAARKNGREEVDYGIFTDDQTEQKWIATVLDETYGVFVFQESLMRLGTVIAGFDAGQRSTLRRAVGKKKKSEMDKVGQMLLEGAEKEFYDEDGNLISPVFSKKTAAHIFDLMQGSAEYLFNACLTGESVLHGGRGARWTVEDLYHRLHGDDTVPAGTCPRCGERPSRKNTPTCGRCASWLYKFNDQRGFDLLAYEADGRIRPQRVKDVHANGVKPVFKITLADGKSVRATGNHRFLTPAGWVHVDDLSVGVALITDGGYEPQRSEPSRRTTEGPRLKVPGNKPWLPGKLNSGFVDGGFTKLKDWTEETIPAAACHECGRTHADGRLERAHLDGNRLNNDPANLRWLCPSHHKAYDYATNGRRRRWEKGHLSAPVEIVSIVPDGEEMTYDVEMVDGSDHNFVVNGIVSHNSHSAAYAYLAYVTAFLKANWPTEYCAADLAIKTDDDKRLSTLQSLRADGIEVQAPDVNRSLAHTAPVDGAVHIGLSEVKDVGSAGWHIVAEREANGPFTSLHDLLSRVRIPNPGSGSTRLSAGAVQGLIEAGALDSLGSRLGLLMSARAAAEAETAPVPAEWSVLEEATRQRQRLGVCLGPHPLTALAEELRDWRVPGQEGERDDRVGQPATPLHRIPDRDRASFVTVGVVAQWSEKGYSGGRRANFTLESSKTTVDGVAWDNTLTSLRRAGIVPKVGDVVAVSGKVRVREVEVGDVEAGTQETVLTKELSATGMWPIRFPEEPVLESAEVFDFADAYQRLRALPAPKAAARTKAAAKPPGKARPAPEPEDVVWPEDDDASDGVATVTDIAERRKRTRTVVVAGSLSGGTNLVVLDGDEALKPGIPVPLAKLRKAGACLRFAREGEEYIFFIPGALTAAEMYAAAGVVPADSPRWKGYQASKGFESWWTLEAEPASAKAERAA